MVMTMPLTVTEPPSRPADAPAVVGQLGPVTLCTMPVIEKPAEPLPERAVPAAGKLGSTGPAGGTIQAPFADVPMGQPLVGGVFGAGGLAVPPAAKALPAVIA